MEARIIAVDEGPIENWKECLSLPMGQIGEIVAHGPVVTQSYFQRPEATKQAKIFDPTSSRYRHRMGDLGYFDSLGRLWFCGRKTQRVDTPRGRLFTIPSEAIFNAHPVVFRSALIGVPFESVIHPVICVELEVGLTTHGPDIVGELLHLAEQHRHTRAIRTVLLHPQFPVDIRHNAKIFREKLAIWAGKQLRRRHWTPKPISEDIALPPTFDELHPLEVEA